MLEARQEFQEVWRSVEPLSVRCIRDFIKNILITGINDKSALIQDGLTELTNNPEANESIKAKLKKIKILNYKPDMSRLEETTLENLLLNSDMEEPLAKMVSELNNSKTLLENHLLKLPSHTLLSMTNNIKSYKVDYKDEAFFYILKECRTQYTLWPKDIKNDTGKRLSEVVKHNLIWVKGLVNTIEKVKNLSINKAVIYAYLKCHYIPENEKNANSLRPLQ